MQRLRELLNRHRVPATAVLVLIIGVAAGVIVAGGERGAAPPIAQYTCERGHAWSAPVGAKPRCPECDAPGITKSRYRCPECGNVFIGVLTQKLDPGRFLYRTPGAADDAWSPVAPTSITCPQCRRAGDPALRFRGLGYGDTNAESPADDHVTH